MDCFWFIIVHFSFPCNTKCIVVSVTLTAFLFYSLFPPMFTYIKSLTQHLPSLPSLPSCLCLLLFLSLWLHMVQSCMSEQQTARRQQSARAGSCASPNYPFNKAWASSTKIFPYSSLQHSFFSPLSLSDLCPATSSLPLLGWPAQAYREDCGSLRHLCQLGEFYLLFSFLLPCISSYRSSQPLIPPPPPPLHLVGSQILFCDLTNELSLHKVKAAWLTGAVSEDWQAWHVTRSHWHRGSKW